MGTPEIVQLVPRSDMFVRTSDFLRNNAHRYPGASYSPGVNNHSITNTGIFINLYRSSRGGIDLHVLVFAYIGHGRQQVYERNIVVNSSRDLAAFVDDYTEALLWPTMENVRQTPSLLLLADLLSALEPTILDGSKSLKPFPNREGDKELFWRVQDILSNGCRPQECSISAKENGTTTIHSKDVSLTCDPMACGVLLTLTCSNLPDYLSLRYRAFTESNMVEQFLLFQGDCERSWPKQFLHDPVVQALTVLFNIFHQEATVATEM